MKNDNILQQMFPEIAMEFDAGSDRPVRVQIVEKAFEEKWSAEQTNKVLLENDQEKLYARSSYEASIIYCLDNGIPYEEWQHLLSECEISDDKNIPFPGGAITLSQLKQYIESESGQNLRTVYRTQLLEKSITEKKDHQGFYGFMKENEEHFSSVREKARYYFCKYLYLYIQEKTDEYYKSCVLSDKARRQFGSGLQEDERGIREKFALEELTFIKSLTPLKKEANKVKPGMTPEEKREYVENASLTPGGIFDEMNYYYFGYISADRMEILFELFGEFEDWPDHTKAKIAHSLGLCSADPDGKQLKAALAELEKMADEQREKEEELDRIYSRDSSSKAKGYQRGRDGENRFRDFIVGKVDINRGTLISFLLFVNDRITLDKDNRVTRMRLNRILSTCGFPQLRPDNEFDCFVMKFLEGDDPMDVVEEEVERLVTSGKDFYLYKIYRDAYCHQKDILKYLL